MVLIPPAIRWLGLCGLMGLTAFVSSAVFVHLSNSGIDWTGQYISNLANRRYGWIFMLGTFVHGWGNLAIGLGLRRSLRYGRLRNWGGMLFCLAAIGIMLAAIFPMDRSDRPPSLVGQMHHTAASTSFALELAALFVFSIAFGRHRHWRQRRSVSLLLSIGAALAMTILFIAIQLNVMPGLAERVALAAFLAWEVWISIHLVRPFRTDS